MPKELTLTEERVWRMIYALERAEQEIKNIRYVLQEELPPTIFDIINDEE